MLTTLLISCALLLSNVTTTELVAQLGDDDPLVREAATRSLARRGMGVFTELRDATTSSDLEVATRASMLLSQLDSETRSVDPPIIAQIVELFQQETLPIDRIWRMQWLTESGSGDGLVGEGVGALCRIVCFEPDRTLRVEAAKLLIARSPAGHDAQRGWFQQIATLIPRGTRDDLLSLVVAFASTYNDTGSNTDNAQERVTELAVSITLMMNRSSDHPHIVGSTNDILIWYAVAELQKAVGLDEAVETSVLTALSLVPELPERRDAMRVVDMTPDSAFVAHSDAAKFLFQRDALAWAQRECDVVIAHNSDTSDHLTALGLTVEIALLKCEYAAAAKYASQALELIPKIENLNVEIYEREYHTKHLYALARDAIERRDADEAKQHVDAALQKEVPQGDELDPATVLGQIDMLILRYELEPSCADTAQRIDAALAALHQLARTESRYDATILNGIAWLMAKTDRVGKENSREVLAMIREAMLQSPENLACHDTLAHIYAACGDFDKAIAMQRRVVAAAPEVTVYRRALNAFLAQSAEKQQRQ